MFVHVIEFIRQPIESDERWMILRLCTRQNFVEERIEITFSVSDLDFEGIICHFRENGDQYCDEREEDENPKEHFLAKWTGRLLRSASGRRTTIKIANAVRKEHDCAEDDHKNAERKNSGVALQSISPDIILILLF
jgi:hypothetical protein